MAEPYVDTNALAKWYLSEPGSEAFVAFIRARKWALVGRLAVVELRCLLARHRRLGRISHDYALAAYATFEGDVRRGYLRIEPLTDRHAFVARELIDAVPEHPLRTLDALHLAIARSAGSPMLATADRVMARAAEALGFEVRDFG